MKKRFFLISMVITIIGILTFAFISTDVYYNNSINYAENQLIVYMNQYDSISYPIDNNNLSNEINQESALAFATKLNGARITFMKYDGTVIADSIDSDIVGTSHANREEVISAIKNNMGYAIRSSESIGESLIYYCVKMESPDVLVRISIPTSSSFKIFADSIPTLIWFLFVDIALCGLISWLSVDWIIKPVEKIAKDSITNKEISTKYSELKPLVEIINNNNKTIQNKINDIQEKKKIENIVLDNMEHGIVILDQDYKVVLINNIASHLLDVSKNVSEINYLNKDQEIYNAIVNKKANLFYRVFDDKDYAIRLTFTDNAVVFLLTDVTEIKKIEKSKDVFIANVTHEMNTPLTSIKGFAELLSSDSLPVEKKNHACEVIVKQADRLSLLVKNIINYSAIQSDDLPNYDVNVSEIIRTLITNFVANLKENNITLISEVDDNLIIKSRNERVIEVMTNLISNAIKYNKKDGQIIICGKKIDDKIVISVEDTGIGIEKENQEKIFDRFYTVDKSHNKNISGFGLGLAIVKKIVNQSKWKLELESEIDKGSKFTLYIDA